LVALAEIDPSNLHLPQELMNRTYWRLACGTLLILLQQSLAG
jgi:hypothetical protein